MRTVAPRSLTEASNNPPNLLVLCALLEFIWTSSAFALSCARESLARFLPKLLFMTLAPIALGGAILARCLFQVHVLKLERGPCQKRALRLFLLMCYFVLPATSTTIFRTFL